MRCEQRSEQPLHGAKARNWPMKKVRLVSRKIRDHRQSNPSHPSQLNQLNWSPRHVNIRLSSSIWARLEQQQQKIHPHDTWTYESINNKVLECIVIPVHPILNDTARKWGNPSRMGKMRLGKWSALLFEGFHQGQQEKGGVLNCSLWSQRSLCDKDPKSLNGNREMRAPLALFLILKRELSNPK